MEKKKKCPHCFTEMDIRAKLCPTCKKKIGKANKKGIAQKHHSPCLLLIIIVALIAILGSIMGKDDNEPQQRRTSAPSTQSNIINTTKSALKSLNIDVRDVKIADGRAKGGEKVLIITYAYSFDEEKYRLAEIVKVLEAGYAANKNMRAGIDSVIAVVGKAQGQAVATIAIKANDAAWFSTTKDSKGYLKKWNVTLFDKSFLPITSANMGW